MCGEGDNILTIDLTSAPCIESMLHLARAQPHVRLYELIDTPEQLCARGGEAAFVHELVIPWLRTAPPAHPPTRFRAPVSVERRYSPGAPWLYVKLYGGVASLDDVLRDAIRSLMADLRSERQIRRCFFVRYRDPDFHLRLRFELDDAELAGVHARLADRIGRLVGAGRVWRVQYDTYEREIDRYGGDHGIQLSEALFDADSEAVLAIVDTVRGNDDGRWLLTLAGMDRLLVDLGLTLAERCRLMTARRDGLGAEYGTTTAFQRELGTKFRIHEAAIREVLAPNGTAYASELAVLRRRTERLAPTVAALREAAASGLLTVPVQGLADSYVHMHANRMLMTDSRPQELVLCDFLRRHYLARLHRR
jgi:thiopeptide-type bacteriocin biosynthesis protein